MIHKVNVIAYFCEVYSDVLGPMQVEDMYRKRYALYYDVQVYNNNNSTLY
jgi:hypothetical protein